MSHSSYSSYRTSEEELQRFIDENNLETPKAQCAIAVAKGLYDSTITSTLGYGTRGEAYLMSNGQVIKVTSDTSEYYQSKKIVGKEIPHVNIIHRCLRVRFQGVVRYVIIQKYVGDNYLEELEIFDELTSIAYEIQEACADSDFDYAKEAINAIDLEYLGHDISEPHWIAEQIEGIAYNLINKVGYIGQDFLPKNTGYDSDRNQIVMIDLGYSRVGKPKREDNIIDLDKKK